MDTGSPGHPKKTGAGWVSGTPFNRVQRLARRLCSETIQFVIMVLYMCFLPNYPCIPALGWILWSVVLCYWPCFFSPGRDSFPIVFSHISWLFFFVQMSRVDVVLSEYSLNASVFIIMITRFILLWVVLFVWSFCFWSSHLIIVLLSCFTFNPCS